MAESPQRQPQPRIRIETLSVRPGAKERRRSPRFEALGPGELRSTTGETIGPLRLVDESPEGIGCVSEAAVEVGQVVEVRLGASPSWRPAVIVSAVARGGFRRIGLSVPRLSASRAA